MNRTVLPSITGDQSDSLGVADQWCADPIIHGVLWLLILTGVQRTVGFLRAILFCRWLDAEQLGLWDMSFGFFMLAGPLVVFALPGAFGRYAGYFRSRGQYRPFFRQTAGACIVLTLLAAALIGMNSRWLSSLLYGSAQQYDLVLMLALGLIAVAAYNYSISMFIALRSMRLAAVMEFLNGTLFAALSISLLLARRENAASVIIAYGGSTALTVLCASWWLKSAWKTATPAVEPLRMRGLWGRLIPFAAWIFLINMLTNLFGIVDRYLILHFAPGSHKETLALVGAYHSSRVLPLLFVSLASMLGTMLLPHLSRDWESGRKELVSAKLSLFLKLLVYGLMSASCAALFIAPWLFGTAFQGKFSAGMAVLPWTLTYSVLFGTAMVAQQYLWCAEKGGLIGLALAAGLIIDVALNLLLLPYWGLFGAVLSATLANMISLLLALYFSQRMGFCLHRGLFIMLCMVPLLCLGPWVSAVVLLALPALEAFSHGLILSKEEKTQIRGGISLYWEKLRRWMRSSLFFLHPRERT
ncbi:MAG: lipopolysaccharide biosynthesis protein [Thermoguttaceae bacterium]